MKKTISLVIPLCNEEENIPLLATAVAAAFEQLPAYDYHCIFVDDGSIDRSLSVLQTMSQQDPRIGWISLSRNFGHQNALKAGLDHAFGDAVVMMDADLQHPPSLIPQMVAEWEAGNDVVYTIRKDHSELPLMKRKTSNLFYELINRLSDIELEQGTADFRLMDQKVVAAFRQFGESDLFMRGLIKWMGYSQKGIEYEPALRVHGHSKYTMRKMVRFALQGITSFSTKPLYIATYLGLLFSLLSALFIPYVFYSYFTGNAVSGWASVIVTIAFFGGLQLMILGILGLYLGKLFVQSKARPHYLVKATNMPPKP